MIQIFTNAYIFNPCTKEWLHQDFSVQNGKICEMAPAGTLLSETFTDLKGARVIPGLIDAHVHIESSHLIPSEFGDAVLAHGVTTVVADPHEIANVAGTPGIEFMIQDAEASPIDIFFMVPSCVPATFDDIGGAVITAEDLKRFVNHPKVLGLGEMMNIPGVLSGDPEVMAKLKLFRHIDGHAPGLTGSALAKYVSYGIRTDHECTTAGEALEKLRLGMYIFLREGGAAKNVTELTSIVTDKTVSRCCFCTDDRSCDALVYEGSIDNCIRVAQKAGMPLETALCMATLSAAECYNLLDRGLLAPGRVADFCTLSHSETFEIAKVYKSGVLREEIPKKVSQTRLETREFSCRIPEQKDLFVPEGADVRVIGVARDEIITESLILPYSPKLQKVVAVDRYASMGFSFGFLEGLPLQKGAIAASIAHDAHNIIATGTSDEEILTAIQAVIEAKGGMAVTVEGKTVTVPLPVGGIMSDEPMELVLAKLQELSEHLALTNAPKSAFTHLSFLSLIVIPHLKITPRGIFDGDAFTYVSLYP